MAWTDPRTWNTGESVDATMMNTHVRDNLKAIGEPVAFTPTWTATGSAPAIGDGSLTGTYTQAGKQFTYLIRLVIGAGTSLGTGSYAFSLPSTAVGARLPVGTCLTFDSSASSVEHRFAYTATTTTVAAADHNGARVSATAPFAWAAGDEIAIAGTYEAA